MKRTRFTFGFMMLAAFAIAAPAASAGSSPEGATSLRYEIRTAGGRLGSATLSIGSVTKRRGKNVRAVRLEGRTEGMVGQVYPFEGTATSLVNDQWLPLTSRWSMEWTKSARSAEVNYKRHRAKGVETRRGQKRKIARTADVHPIDLASALAWLPNQTLTPGMELKRPLVEGVTPTDMVANVGAVETIILPVGEREVVPVKVLLKRGKRTAHATVWVGVHDHTPYQIRFEHRMLGAIDIVLTGTTRS